MIIYNLSYLCSVYFNIFKTEILIFFFSVSAIKTFRRMERLQMKTVNRSLAINYSRVAKIISNKLIMLHCIPYGTLFCTLFNMVFNIHIANNKELTPNV